MASLRSVELPEILPKLGQVTPFSGEDAKGISDLFVCALGFEDRCLAFPERLSASGYRAHLAVYAEYSTNRDDNRINLPALEEALRTFSSEIKGVATDDEDFVSRLRGIVEQLGGSDSQGHRPRVTLDISVAANRHVLQCMKALLEIDVWLRILYAEAATYHPTRQEYEGDRERWQSPESLGLERGVLKVESSKHHPGIHLDPIPDRILLFPGFKAERTRAVIANVDPSLLTSASDKLIWFVGKPLHEEDAWRREAMEEINGIPAAARRYEVSTFDYRESVRALETVYLESVGKYKLTLSPLGSKLQAVAAALFCHMHPDVRVMLTSPLEYNASQYSEGRKSLWKIDFGETPKLRQLLGSVGQLEIEDCS